VGQLRCQCGAEGARVRTVIMSRQRPIHQRRTTLTDSDTPCVQHASTCPLAVTMHNAGAGGWSACYMYIATCETDGWWLRSWLGHGSLLPVAFSSLSSSSHFATGAALPKSPL
jgi:hypothetical protein